jgi:hypothetical protein
MIENIWYKDWKSLIEPTNLPKFFPNTGMTFAEQLNALMRFSIYFSIILFAIKKNTLVFYIVVMCAVLTFFLYEFDNKNKINKKELFSKMNLFDDVQNSNICVKPTPNNPFMNVLMTDYKQFPNRPPACNINNGLISNMAEKYFDNNLFRDVDDVWGRKSSSRIWYTNPVTTIPSDQKSYAEFLYNIGPTCKESSLMCYKNQYRDLKL